MNTPFLVSEFRKYTFRFLERKLEKLHCIPSLLSSSTCVTFFFRMFFSAVWGRHLVAVRFLGELI